MQINIEEGSSVEQSFFFEAVPNKLLEDKDTKQILTKWGLFDTMRIGSFRFNQHYQDYDNARFLQDLFSNPNVKYILNNLQLSNEPVKEVQFKKLRCTELSMEMFDQLQSTKVVTGKYISKTMPDYFEGIEVADKLREALIIQDSQAYCTFDENQRNQLLLKVFQLLVIGGSLNQYEDLIEPYLQWTKKLYKSIVAVRKRPQTADLFIESYAYEIKSISKRPVCDYNPQNVVYVIINPSLRTAYVLVNRWKKFW